MFSVLELVALMVKACPGISVNILGDEDFFLHLCAHLYKEATTLPWIEMHRDMTLYKYCDIYIIPYIEGMTLEDATNQLRENQPIMSTSFYGAQLATGTCKGQYTFEANKE